MFRTKSKDSSSSESIFELIKLLGIMLVISGDTFILCLHRRCSGFCNDATHLFEFLASSSLVSSGRMFTSLLCKSLEEIELVTDMLDGVLLLERLFGLLALLGLDSF